MGMKRNGHHFITLIIYKYIIMSLFYSTSFKFPHFPQNKA